MPQGNPFTSGIAPAAMAGLAPELVSDQSAILRQKQLADLLRRQGAEPMGPTEMVSGWAVKKSPLEGVAKIAQALGGQYLASQADEKQAALAQSLQQRQLESISSIFGGAPADPNAAAQTVQKWGDANGDSGPPDPVLVQALQQRQQAASPGGTTPQQRKVVEYAVKTGNNDLLAKMLANFGEMTTDQKNWAATGQDPFEVGRQQAAERRTKGVFQLQPGTTSIDFLTGTERYQPKLGEGMMLNGGQVSAAPGYVDTNAEIAGRQAGAVAGAQAQNKLITVNTPAGPVMKTEAQAVQEAGGGGGMPLIDAVIKAESNGNQSAVSPKGAVGLGQIMPGTAKGLGGDPKNPVHNVAMAQTLLDRLQAKYGNDQYALAAYNWGEGNVDKWLKSGADPSRLPAETQKYVATVQRLSGGAQKPAGIPLQSGGAEAFAKESASKAAAELSASRDKARGADDELSAIAESRAAIKAGAFQGMGADTKTDAVKLAQALNIPIDGSKAANTDYLRSSLGKGMLDNAKKLGVNPTDADAKRLDVIIGTIGKDPKAMDKILDWRESLAVKTIDLHNRDVDSAIAGGARFPYEMRVKRTPSAAPPAAKFEVGKVYTDAKGNKATYQADGTWKQ